MAFTRDNLGTSSSFTRSGAVTAVDTPNFQVFNVVSGPSTFSLNNKWSITSQFGSNPKLQFKYNNITMLELTNAGINNITMPSLKLNHNSGFPSYSGHLNGDVVKVNGELYVLAGGDNIGN